jgi:hypothetical protein
MLVASIHEAAQQPYAPIKAYLYKLKKTTPLPAYFVDQDNEIKIDIDHPEWLAYLDLRRSQALAAKENRSPGENINTSTNAKVDQSKNELDNIIDKARYAKANEYILKNERLELTNEQLRLNLMRAAGDLIEYKLCDFLFMGFLDRFAIEVTQLTKKLRPIIVNLVKVQRSDEIIRRINAELESILITIKKAQAEDVAAWKAEK